MLGPCGAAFSVVNGLFAGAVSLCHATEEAAAELVVGFDHAQEFLLPYDGGQTGVILAFNAQRLALQRERLVNDPAAVAVARLALCGTACDGMLLVVNGAQLLLHLEVDR